MWIATLVSLSLTPLRIDEVKAVRRASAQLDVRGQAVLFETGIYAVMPADLPDRLALAALDVAGAAPQVARMCAPGEAVLVLGAGGKSGVLCAFEARRRFRSSEAVHRDDRRIHGCNSSPTPVGMNVAANSSRCGAK